MDKSLKDLLAAESDAEQLVAEGEEKRDNIINKALKDADALVEQFNNRVAEIHQPFLDKAIENAEQNINELSLRYEEHNKELQTLAKQNEFIALDAVIKFILAEQS